MVPSLTEFLFFQKGGSNERKKSFKDKLDGFFEISSRGSSFKVEALAGIATF